MEIFATIVMLAWIPAVLLMFALLPPRRAVIISFIGAWLFLPVVSYPLPFLPDYTKMSATCAGVFMGALIFDGKRLLKFSPSWVDLPALVFCISPFFSSTMNGLGLWDGVSGIMSHAVSWGLPYFIGRVYFTDTEAIRELAVNMFIGGLLYIPFCLFEIRMSPRLHLMVYGSALRGVQWRMGGWRPSVFMDSGLQLGLWMAGTTLIGLWLWHTGAIKRLHGVAMSWLVWPLFVTTVLCRATGATLLMFAGLGVLWFCSVTRSRIALVCLIALPPTYVALRASGLWNAEQVVSVARMFSKDRAQSFQFRVKNENLLVAKALRRPLLGWGGWGRSRIYDEFNNDVSITDGRWVIEIGAHGLLGLASCFAMLLLPAALLTHKYSARRLLSKEMAPALALAVLMVMYALDCIPNAMANPVYMLAGGAVVGVTVARPKLNRAAGQDGAPVATGDRTVGDCVPIRRLHPGSTH